MRARATLVVLFLTLFTTLPLVSSHAAPPRIQAQTDDQGGGDDSSADDGSKGGQSGADAETGAGKKGSAPAEEEAGPPWTYQMARIVLAMLLLLGLGIGLMYWRLVASRQRSAA